MAFIVPRQLMVNICWSYKCKTICVKWGIKFYCSFLSGDFNFPHINWNYQAAPGLDNLPNLFCNITSDTFLTQMNHSPRRITDNTKNILDLVFTNQPKRVCGMKTFDCQDESEVVYTKDQT